MWPLSMKIANALGFFVHRPIPASEYILLEDNMINVRKSYGSFVLPLPRQVQLQSCVSGCPVH